MRRANYDKYPSTKVDGTIWLGWKDIRSELSGRKLLAVGRRSDRGIRPVRGRVGDKHT